jgi:hypothetical protein
MLAGLGLAAWDGHGISFADSWATAFSLFLIFLAVGACISALAAAIAAFALYRQWRDKKLGRYTEFHE